MTRALADRLRSVLPPDGVGTFEGANLPSVPLALPAADDEWRAVLEVARADALGVLLLGNGSKLALFPPAADVDLVVSSRRHSGVLSYEPGDGTVCARAGTSIAELASVVRAGGHRLTPEVPRPDEASLGGVLGAGQSGFDRLRVGPLRNHVLGMRVLLADGTIAHTGGQLVKNVTGYALHRLYTGSSGSLCAILDASLRLFARPDERAVVRATTRDRSAALALARRVLQLPVRPSAVTIHDHERGAWIVSVAIDGRSEVVDDALARTLALLSAARVARGEDGEAALIEERDRERAGGHWPVLTLAGRPSRLAAALDAVGSAALACDLTTRIVAHPGIATAAVHAEGDDGEALGAFVRRVHASVERFSVRTGELPRGLRTELDAKRPALPGAKLMDELRAALDPEQLFAGAQR